MSKWYKLHCTNDYEINKLGQVRNSRTKFILKSFSDKDGYLRYTIFINKRRKKYFVHRLLAELFIPNPENKPQVNHKDGIKTNNKLSNLEWVTYGENVRHGYRLYLYNNNPNYVKLNREDIKKIKSLNGKLTRQEIADIFKVNKSTVTRIINGELWSHINE